MASSSSSSSSSSGATLPTGAGGPLPTRSSPFYHQYPYRYRTDGDRAVPVVTGIGGHDGMGQRMWDGKLKGEGFVYVYTASGME